MAEKAKAPATKADVLSSVLRTHVEERTDSYKLSNNIQMHAVTLSMHVTRTHARTNKVYNGEMNYRSEQLSQKAV